MPKKIMFESAVHHFLTAARRLHVSLQSGPAERQQTYDAFVASLRFTHLPDGVMEVRWTYPSEGSAPVSYRDASFYLRGDTGRHVEKQRALGLVVSEDPIRKHNEQLFVERVGAVASAAGIDVTGLG